MKKIFIYSIILFMLLGVTGCNKNKRNIDAIKFKGEYESINGKTNEKAEKEYRTVNISEDNPFVYKTEDEIVDMINNKKTFVVYFGFSSCPWCRSIIESLIEVSKDLNINKIYYVNIRPNDEDIRDVITVNEDGTYITTKEGTDGYKKLLILMHDALSDYNLKDKDGNSVDVKEKRIYAPNVIAIVDGKATKMDTGISSKQDDAYMNLTDEMKEETYTKLESVLKEIKSTCNSKEICMN